MNHDNKFKIVFICTGNRARSCLAEAHVRRLADGLPVEVSSAGVLDLGPVPALAEAIEVGQAGGVDLSSHRARTLREAELQGADLVIGFERNHVAEAVVEGNADPAKTFSLKELTRLLDGIPRSNSGSPVEEARKVVAKAAKHRAAAGFVPDEEIADPLGAPRSYFNDLGDTITQLSTRLVEGLFGRT